MPVSYTECIAADHLRVAETARQAGETKMTTDICFHGVASLSIERGGTDRYDWTKLRTIDSHGRETAVITMFASTGHVEIIDLTADDEPAETDPRGPYEPISNFSRQHLHGDR